MKKIVVLLKTWHFKMMPKYSFDYFLQRCQVLGGHKQLLVIYLLYRHICARLEMYIKVKMYGNKNNNKM